MQLGTKTEGDRQRHGSHCDFFQLGQEMPERRIIQNDNASYHGMAKVYKKNKYFYNSRRITIKYDISEIYLKRIVFQKDGYYDALFTYIHELCHIFGGDASNAFSLGLTFAMEILLSNYAIVEKFKYKWDLLYK